MVEKAICEMDFDELVFEYDKCEEASKSDYLSPDMRRYYKDRCEAIAIFLLMVEGRFS